MEVFDFFCQSDYIVREFFLLLFSMLEGENEDEREDEYEDASEGALRY